jgi:peroxiredoxin Q/BCP
MTDQPGLTIGSLAPDFSLSASNATEIKLADFRSKSNVVLFFIREFIWMQCRSHASQLGRLYKDFQAANCEIILILGEPVDLAVRYSETLHLPFPVLADPDRSVYHRYGLDKFIGLVQRTASVIVDRDGTIRYLKLALNPMTWLQESRELLSFVKSLSNDGSGTGPQ